MNRSVQIRDLAAGTAAALAVLTVLVGVPAALMTFVGWPLPAQLPSFDTVATALRYGQIASSTLLRSLAVVLWVTWAMTALSIALEAIAVLRGTVARALPGLGTLQTTAARLVATIMLLSSMTGRAVAAPPELAPPRPPTPIELASGPGDDLVPAAAAPRPAAPRTPSWTVQRRDSLWTIAERSLGDGHRWKEIATLNVGRVQPDGGQLATGDTLIRPGWRLTLPPEADVAQPERVTVDGGDDLWSLSEEHLNNGDRWPEIFARNRGRQQNDGGRLTDPDLIRPGWVLRLPSNDAAPGDAPGDDAPDDLPSDDGRPSGDTWPAAAEPVDRASAPSEPSEVPQSDVPPPVTPSTLRPSVSAASPVSAAPTADASVTPLATPTATRRPPVTPAYPGAAVFAGAAVLAAGLVGLLARRRRRWLQRRTVGAVLDEVEPEAAELERWLRSMADHDLHERLDRVLRVLTDHFAEHSVAPEVSAIEFGAQTTLRLAEPNEDPPPGVTSSQDGRRWTLAPELEMGPVAPQRYLPALVSCGRLASGELLLLNLLDTGVLGVLGTEAGAAAALTSWTAELAAGGAMAGVEIVVVGAHHPLVERLVRVTVVADVGEALERVQRVIDDPDGIAARVVVISGTPHETADDALRSAATDPRVAVVLAGVLQATATLEIAGARVRLLPDDTWFDAPEWLSPQDWDRFGDLLRQPDRDHTPASVPSPLLPVAAFEHNGAGIDLVSEAHDGGAIEIGLLGPLTIDGRPASIGPEVAPLLTYLAAHPTGGDPAALASTLWPGRSDVAALLDQALAAIADELDDRCDGSPPVRTDDGRLEVPATVTTDVRVFRDLLQRLDQQSPVVQARRMYAALDLVRGEPFAQGADWAHADGTAVRTVGLIVDAAHRLAMQSLTIGDVERADWAITAGLRAAPTCELLFRDRMRIAGARGDLVALDACMRDLQTRVEADDSWVTPETTALHEQLRSQPRVTDSASRHQDAS